MIPKKESSHNSFLNPIYHRQKINVTPKGVRLSEKLQITAALCNEI